MTTPSAPAAPVRFASLGLTDAIVQAVAALGYEEPTPIQREAIPLLLAGRDLMGQAGTGTGKTAAFALPLLERLAAGTRGPKGAARALILVPTRELAMQVAEAIHKYAKRTPLTVVPLYGGAPMDQQIRALRRGADVVVATPGRALDHLRRQTLMLDALEVLVLDEADEMLDMGFAEDLEVLLTATPATRQTALFAATMAPRIAAIAERHLRDPARITIKAEKRTGKLPQIRQTAYVVARAYKGPSLGRILEFEDPASAIVFCRTRVEVDELTDTLKSHGYAAQALHGGMEQRERDRVMQLFRSERAEILVATDVAARGLDIEHVSHVINYDIPTTAEVYVHRIGRTGRVGREGVAITLCDPREQRMLRQIEALTKQKIEVVPLPTPAALRAKRLESMRTGLLARITKGGLDEVRTFVAALASDVDVVDIAAAAIALMNDDKESTEPSIPAPAPAPPAPFRRDREGRSHDRGPRSSDRGARPHDRDRAQDAPRVERSHDRERAQDAPRVERSHDRERAQDAPRVERSHDRERAQDAPRVERSHDRERAQDAPRVERPAPRPERRERPADRGERPRDRERSHDAPRAERADRAPSDATGDAKTVLWVGAGKAAGMRPGDLVGAITGEAGLNSRQIGAIKIVSDHSLVEIPDPLVNRVIRALRSTTIRGQKVEVRPMPQGLVKPRS